MEKFLSLLTPVGLAAMEYALQEAMLDDPTLNDLSFTILLSLSEAVRKQGIATIGDDYPALACLVSEALETVDVPA